MDYHHLQQMLAQGVSKAEIARKLGMSRKTLYKWLSRPESGFVDWVEDSVHRRRKLSVYEDFLLTRLAQCPEARPALLLDWLKEAHPDLPALNRKTFYNYIDYLRRHHHLPVPAVNSRQYLCVETLEYGYQAQVDFGECTLSKAGGGGQKVHFFVMSLSRSGYLYVHFQTNPFDAYAVVQCHEAAFGFFGGIPQQLVYDQDRRMIRQENLGEILYTQVFHQYLLSRSFAIYLCRKDDPESKGKVERLVGYVKGNFLAHRLFEGLDALRDQCRAWLARTANVRQHGSTQKQVNEEFEIEKAHLTPYHPLALELPEPLMSRVVRKDHMITYQGNRYSLPLGSYQPKRWVYIREQEEQLLILDEHRQEIARHRLSHQKGQNIINTHHQRDQQAGLPALTQALVALFTQTALAEAYLAALTKQTDPRYRRDQLSHIQKTLVGQPLPVRDQALAYCTKMAIYSARDLADVVRFLAIEHRNQNPAPAPAPPGPRPTIEQQEALQNQKQAQADKSSLQTYEAIFHQSKP